MTRKGTKQKYPNISSPTPFSQMAESNLCNKEYHFQPEEFFECDVQKKILKTVKNRPSPTALFTDFIIGLPHCGFLNRQAVTLALNDFYSLGWNVSSIQKSLISPGVGPPLAGTWGRAGPSACSTAFISLQVIDFKDRPHHELSRQCPFRMGLLRSVPASGLRTMVEMKQIFLEKLLL